ncbi:alpha/beta fold hydrolase [Rhodococcus qingshengii]|jgi:pimeloyl-ACP methyl ester carboxylesterase|uniref:Alpha/beta hydrolase n=2 Tax=Rhodococcus TaxID=1827 RepID=A0A1C4FWE6_RHOSG|nr:MULTISPECIES: alpha/beta hydrolase [Rhodococcus]EEN84732.1 hydrolase, alpha/beta domain protein [Rhodococcus erythropolis SK121]KLN71931.1 alpha/beta hydrolase [Rhodococcus erythropolis]NHE64624.1 alpha/beta hydrolase [Rhodococcus sp. D-46]OCC18186.1 alpha/beta hydrolase [Prescottella equi]ANQ72059.1 alpha/beta hydrolase [Rhodococcus sp. 008]
MTVATINGIPINYQVKGDGDLVVLIMGTGSPGRVWDLHQTPALVAAGYRVCTFDNRGIAPSGESLGGITMPDMVADTAGLIEHLGGGPAHVIGTSMGARVAQELTLARPDLVRKAVFLAGHARMDHFQQVLTEGERQLFDSGVALPAKYRAAVTAVMNLSPATLADDHSARDWMDIFEFTGGATSPGVRAQLGMDRAFDRRGAYKSIMRPCLSVAFADDRMIPPYLSREVADCIATASYEEIPDAGHYGYLERPEAVNKVLIDFLAK